MKAYSDVCGAADDVLVDSIPCVVEAALDVENVEVGSGSTTKANFNPVGSPDASGLAICQPLSQPRTFIVPLPHSIIKLSIYDRWCKVGPIKKLVNGSVRYIKCDSTDLYFGEDILNLSCPLCNCCPELQHSSHSNHEPCLGTICLVSYSSFLGPSVCTLIQCIDIRVA
ncbi:hypothetical protein HAX54_043013, partial [Datura stramonium]|nr:hypothetical protein [Datura stramonium]